jgi:hypothetical protein
MKDWMNGDRNLTVKEFKTQRFRVNVNFVKLCGTVEVTVSHIYLSFKLLHKLLPILSFFVLSLMPPKVLSGDPYKQWHRHGPQVRTRRPEGEVVYFSLFSWHR